MPEEALVEIAVLHNSHEAFSPAAGILTRSWARTLRDGDIMVYYSGGTGILLDRLKLNQRSSVSQALKFAEPK